MNDQAQRQAIDKLATLMRDIPVAMLTTCRNDRALHCRPMVNVNQAFAGELWFFTLQSDPKVQEIRDNPSVNVGFASPQDGRYVSVSGTASLVHDRSRAALLWRDDVCRKWFPNGLDTTDLALVKVDLIDAEYWDETTTAMQAMSGMVSVAFSGHRPANVNHETVQWQESTPAAQTGQ